jgi:transposase-like protein
MTKRSPFRSFKTSPEIIRLAVMMYVRFPLSLRNVEDLLHERGIDISYEKVRFGAVRRMRTSLSGLPNAGTYAEQS